MQIWGEHAENHERFTRIRLDEVALRNTSGERLSRLKYWSCLAVQIGALLALLSVWRPV
jgi:hypothetical protein